jgi:3-oxoacyl-(acyl-carrier-protein) synthase
VPQKPIDMEIGKAISNNFGFGGQNASILTSRYDQKN